MKIGQKQHNCEIFFEKSRIKTLEEDQRVINLIKKQIGIANFVLDINTMQLVALKYSKSNNLLYSHTLMHWTI